MGQQQNVVFEEHWVVYRIPQLSQQTDNPSMGHPWLPTLASEIELIQRKM